MPLENDLELTALLVEVNGSRTTKCLFEILTTRVTGRVSVEKTKDKQSDKKGHNKVNHNLKSQH